MHVAQPAAGNCACRRLPLPQEESLLDSAAQQQEAKFPRLLREEAPPAADAHETHAATQLSVLLEALGTPLRLDRPAAHLWRRAGRHNISATGHLIKLGAYLLHLRSLTAAGAWGPALQDHGISRQRASDAMRIIQWFAETHVRSVGHGRKLPHLAVRKLLAASRIPLSILEKNGLNLEAIAGTHFAKLAAEIARLKKSLQKAQAGPPVARKMEREYRAALRRLVDNYREAAALGTELLDLGVQAHGNMRHGLVRRITAAHEAAFSQLTVITEAELGPALLAAQSGAKTEKKIRR